MNDALLAATDLNALLTSLLSGPWAKVALAVVGVYLLWSTSSKTDSTTPTFWDKLKGIWAQLTRGTTPETSDAAVVAAKVDPLSRFRTATDLREWLRSRGKTEAVAAFDKDIWPYLVEDSLLTVQATASTKAVK